MPNPFFRFKQFTVFHDKCAMKVGTDGVLLGAWADVGSTTKALDVGTGSGLIALMLAQRNTELDIDAIDIDMDAVIQSRDNFIKSPFAGRLRSIHTSLQDFNPDQPGKYDLIVSNPPYFSRSLKNADSKKSLARHTDGLPLETLLAKSSALLTDKGHISIIYPFESEGLITDYAQQWELYPKRVTEVLPTPSSSPRRLLIELARAKTDIVDRKQLIIENARHEYSDEFRLLLKDFYLKF